MLKPLSNPNTILKNGYPKTERVRKKGKLFANRHLIGLDEDGGVIKRVQ